MVRKNVKTVRKGPEISFIIPHRESESVEKTVKRIRTVMKTKHKGKSYEIFAVSGNQPSKQRNRAVKQAKGKYLYFLDNDSIIHTNTVGHALKLFKTIPKLGIVGGPSLTPKSDTLLQKAFGHALTSVFATGGRIRSRYLSVGKPRPADEYELILCNMMVRRDLFLKVKGFREDIYPNEENILVNEIRKRGSLVYHHPEMAVERSQRPTLGKFIRQMLTYGRGRMDQTFSQPSSFNLFFLIPFFFPFFIILLPLIVWLFRDINFLIPIFPALFYFSCTVFFTLLDAFSVGSLRFIPLLPGLFFLVHFFYGTGMVWGLIRNIFIGRRKVKNFKCRIHKLK